MIKHEQTINGLHFLDDGDFFHGVVHFPRWELIVKHLDFISELSYLLNECLEECVDD